MLLHLMGLFGFLFCRFRLFLSWLSLSLRAVTFIVSEPFIDSETSIVSALVAAELSAVCVLFDAAYDAEHLAPLAFSLSTDSEVQVKDSSCPFARLCASFLVTLALSAHEPTHLFTLFAMLFAAPINLVTLRIACGKTFRTQYH